MIKEAIRKISTECSEAATVTLQKEFREVIELYKSIEAF